MYHLYNGRCVFICGFWAEPLNRKVAVVLLLCTAPDKNANAWDFQYCSFQLCFLKSN